MVSVLLLMAAVAAAEAEPTVGPESGPTVEPESEPRGSEAESEPAENDSSPPTDSAEETAKEQVPSPLPLSSGASDAEDVPAPVTTDGTERDLEHRFKRNRRKRVEDAILGPPGEKVDYGEPGVSPGDADTFVGAERPAMLRPRWPGGALALGAFVGFGAGYYYAGVPRWGLTFTLVDAVLVGGFVTSTIMLNNLVIEHDFNQGKSLARNERDFTKREQRWYTASIIFALAGVGSRVFQAFGGLRAARRTNATLESFSFVPLGNGGALDVRWSW